MVERIGSGRESALAREAMRAAQRFASEKAAPAADAPGAATGALGATGSGPSVDFSGLVENGLSKVDDKVHAAESLPLELLSGKVNDFHEIAVQLKSAEISFKFAMEIRNKLVDAYREIMRMSV